ncbi:MULTISPECIES: hypothetical protein [Streptomyces]|uniref:Proteinase inhibitor I4 serpin n=1 Tax=Streptomyces vulcanius TaxID=1441876 RepID=A0ABV9AKF0_9ACTN
MGEALTTGTVRALTARWAGHIGPDTNSVFSATGVWPLLAFLADGATGPARQELADAVGVPAGREKWAGGVGTPTGRRR